MVQNLNSFPGKIENSAYCAPKESEDLFLWEIRRLSCHSSILVNLKLYRSFSQEASKSFQTALTRIDYQHEINNRMMWGSILSVFCYVQIDLNNYSHCRWEGCFTYLNRWRSVVQWNWLTYCYGDSNRGLSKNISRCQDFPSLCNNHHQADC